MPWHWPALSQDKLFRLWVLWKSCFRNQTCGRLPTLIWKLWNWLRLSYNLDIWLLYRLCVCMVCVVLIAGESLYPSSQVSFASVCDVHLLSLICHSYSHCALNCKAMGLDPQPLVHKCRTLVTVTPEWCFCTVIHGILRNVAPLFLHSSPLALVITVFQ